MSAPTNRVRILLLLAVMLTVLGGIALWAQGENGLRPATTSPPVPPVLASPVLAPPVSGSPRDAGAIGTAATSPAERRPAGAAIASGIAGRLLQDGRPLAGADVRTVDPHEAEHCRSGADGAFFLPLPAGRHDLAVAGAGVPRGFTWGSFWLAHGERHELGDLAVPRAAVITGRVIDEQDRPLAGVRVFACPARDGSQPFDLDVVDPAAPEADANVLTGADGRFAIPDLLPGVLAVRCEHPDHALDNHLHLNLRCEVEPGACGDVGDIVLRRAEELRGFVLDRRGAPITGARVTPGSDEYSRFTLFPRQSVLTGAGGGFVLRAAGERTALRIDKEGFETQVCERVQEQPRPLRITLQPALVVAGTVQGTMGRAGTLRLGTHPDSSRKWTVGRSWIEDYLYASHPIAADGSFRIAGMAAGKWLVSGTIPGAGNILPTTCELPLQQPLALQVVAHRELTVKVVDELGTGVAWARLARQLGGPERRRSWPGEFGLEDLEADGGGRVIVRMPVHEGLLLTGTAPGHFRGELELPAGGIPAATTLVLPRGGVLHGRIAEPTLGAHARVLVQCSPLDSPDTYGVAISPDSRGSFRSGPLAPGRYEVTIVLRDARGASTWEQRVAAPVPLLEGDVQVSEPVQVEVVAGGDTAVELPAPRCRELRGRVLARGVPVAGAVVFAMAGDGEPGALLVPMLPRSGGDSGVARADAEGRFRFLATTARSCELRARHARGGAWSAPVVVQWTDPVANLQRDIELPTAAIRGSFDVGVIVPVERRALHVELYRLADAAMNSRDSVWSVDGRKWLREVVQRFAVATSGNFAFECLPPGGWVLRLVQRDRILLQRVLHTTGDEVLELGRLAAPTGVAPRLRCGLTQDFGVLVLQVEPGNEDGVFLRVVTKTEGGFAWGSLPPGRYRLRPVRMKEMTYDGPDGGGSWFEPGEAAGEAVDVAVHADGSCTPAEVWPGGIKE